MKIAIIDADLIGRKNHRFPNLACMKISGFYKEQSHHVKLKLDYSDLENYDKVFVSKAFTDTYIPEAVFQMENVEYGGTGFFYDKAPPLPYEIEHHIPDYHLYDDYIETQVSKGINKKQYKYYTDYSIGFATRGCFRKCDFCVNKNYNKVTLHSPLLEFVDPSRKKICLLDDNVLGCSKWREIFTTLQKSGKPFQFKQGLDIRLLTDEMCQIIFESKYDGEYIFAFDDISEYELIEKKLQLIRKYTDKTLKLYVLCAFDRKDKWDNEFWKQDIFDTFKRVELLMRYRCLPYIMRFEAYNTSPYRGMYINIASWCNMVRVYKTLSFREFCIKNGENLSRHRYMVEFENKYPTIGKYMDMKYKGYSNMGQD